MTKLLSAIAYQFWLWLRSPNPMWQGVSKRSNDLTYFFANNNKYSTEWAACDRVLQDTHARVAHGGFTASASHALSAFSTRTKSRRVCGQQQWRKSIVAATATPASLVDSQRSKRGLRAAGLAITGHEAAAGGAYPPAAAAALHPAHAAAALIRQSSPA